MALALFLGGQITFDFTFWVFWSPRSSSWRPFPSCVAIWSGVKRCGEMEMCCFDVVSWCQQVNRKHVDVWNRKMESLWRFVFCWRLMANNLFWEQIYNVHLGTVCCGQSTCILARAPKEMSHLERKTLGSDFNPRSLRIIFLVKVGVLVFSCTRALLLLKLFCHRVIPKKWAVLVDQRTSWGQIWQDH